MLSWMLPVMNARHSEACLRGKVTLLLLILPPGRSTWTGVWPAVTRDDHRRALLCLLLWEDTVRVLFSILGGWFSHDEKNTELERWRPPSSSHMSRLLHKSGPLMMGRSCINPASYWALENISLASMSCKFNINPKSQHFSLKWCGHSCML